MNDTPPNEGWTVMAFFAGVAAGAVMTYVGILLQRLMLL